ncbi:hypothetical protein ENBRE01_0870 [Enteropsectra breve]|nr:hypothetical protein ENBRE01_0870 [Enteropsectra breve]
MDPNTENQLNNKIHFDMATMVKIVKPFTGSPDEDAEIWIQTFTLLADANDIDEARRPQIMICCLRETALQWAAEVMAMSKYLSFNEIISLFKLRFSGRATNEKIFHRLISSREAQNSSELANALKDASILNRVQYLSVEALKDIISNKVPGHLKPTIRQAGQANKSWQEFMKYMEENVLPTMISINNCGVDSNASIHVEGGFSSVKTSSYKKQEKNRSQKCPIHGLGHSENSCFVIKKLKQQGYSLKKNFSYQNSNVNAIDDDEDESKNISSSSFNYKNYKLKNPFMKKGLVYENEAPILIDTGADTSIVNKKFIPLSHLTKIKPTDIKAKSACGNPLQILGRIENIPVDIDNEHYEIEGLVTEKVPPYCIIGADAIMNNPSLIHNFKKNIKLNINSVILSNDTKSKIHLLLQNYNNIFKNEITENIICNLASHSIHTLSDKMIKSGQSRTPIAYEQAIEDEIQKNIRLGIISESSSAWSSRIVPIKKKDGSLRLCIDFRPLNLITIKDQYPIPRIDEILDSLGKAKYFSILDATSGYYQIEIAPCDRWKTAFSWKGGLFEFNRMPFGLCNGPATFQRAMDKLFKQEKNKFVLPYFDDIIIFSDSIEDHIQHLEVVFSKIRSANMVLNKKSASS